MTASIGDLMVLNKQNNRKSVDQLQYRNSIIFFTGNYKFHPNALNSNKGTNLLIMCGVVHIISINNHFYVYTCTNVIIISTEGQILKVIAFPSFT